MNVLCDNWAVLNQGASRVGVLGEVPLGTLGVVFVHVVVHMHTDLLGMEPFQLEVGPLDGPLGGSLGVHQGILEGGMPFGGILWAVDPGPGQVLPLAALGV